MALPIEPKSSRSVDCSNGVDGDRQPLSAVDAVRCLYMARVFESTGDKEAARRWREKARRWFDERGSPAPADS